MTEPSDTDLMAELARGDVAALAPLITRHQPRVLSLAYRMLGRWDQAEDVGQEAFLRVVRAAGSYRPTAQFTTWLYRIVVNLCLDAKRRSARDPGELAESVAAASGDNPQACYAFFNDRQGQSGGDSRGEQRPAHFPVSAWSSAAQEADGLAQQVATTRLFGEDVELNVSQLEAPLQNAGAAAIVEQMGIGAGLEQLGGVGQDFEPIRSGEFWAGLG